MSTKFLSPGWRMPRNANQSKSSNYSMEFLTTTRIPDITGLGLGTSVDTFSISLWFNKSNMNYGIVFSTYSGSGSYISSGVAIDLNTDGTIAFYNGANRKTTSAQYSINTWYNLVVTSDGTTVKMYVNGSQVTLDSTTVVARDFTNVWINSAKYSASNFGIIGKIDGVSIFDYALSSSQVTTLYGDSTNGPGNPMALPSPPIAYYPLGTSAWNGQYLAENNAIGDYVFSFDGSNDYINLNSDILFNTNQSFSFSSWVNLDSYSDPYPYLANLKTNVTDGIGIFISNNSSYAGVNVGSTDSSITKGRTTGDISSTFLNSWNNVVVTYNGNGANTLSNFSIYVNGSPVALTTTGNYSTMPNTANNIGRRSNSYHYLDGKLSNVQIFNTALTGADVETLYNYGSPIKTLANIPQSSNLKAWYKLDASEAYNNTTTEWSIDNNQNPSAYASSLDFDSASSDYIDCGNNASLYPRTGDMSYSFWVNPDVLSGLQTIYGRTAMSTSAKGVNINLSGSEVRVFMGVGVSGQWGVNTGGGTGGGALITSNSGLTVGQWSHIVLTLDRDGDGVIYINGVAVVTAAMNPNDYSSVDIVDSRSNLIGNGNAYSNVKISNMSVWNTSLTSAQVSELYNNGTPSNLSNHSATSNLISWYKLNNTTTGIEDAKSSNDGTNNGATEYAGFVNVLAGESSGMSQANLIQSDLQTVAPYSKYAMDFDAASVDSITINADLSSYSSITVSTWAKFVSATGFQYVFDAGTWTGTGPAGIKLGISKKQTTNEIATYDGLTNHSTGVNVALNTWYHITVTHTGTTRKVYLNGSLIGTFVSGNLNLNAINYIGKFSLNSNFMDGSISNVSIWNTDLTSSQVTEIYNEGLPGNLNSHSAYSNLVSWWQLGENSSFDGNDWIVADEKGTNNGTSTGMPVGALVNGVGTTANGLSSGMSEGNLVGDAPYSTANALSTNMVVTSRVSGSGNTP